MAGAAVPWAASRRTVFGCLGIFWGLASFVLTQGAAKDRIAEVLEACAQPDAVTAFSQPNSPYHPFEPKLGGQFACVATQTLADLVGAYPAGWIVWLGALSVSLPATIAIVVEAGRGGIEKRSFLLRYPTLLTVLVQFLTVAVVFNLLWLPSYCWGRSDVRGAVHVARAKFVAPLTLVPPLLLSLLAFGLELRTPAWTWNAGIVCGPWAALTPLLAWNMTPPPDPEASKSGLMVRAVVGAYSKAAILAGALWLFVVGLAVQTYGFHASAVYQGLWSESHPNVKYLLLEGIGVFVGLLTYLAYVRESAAIRAFLLTLVLGPGTACAVVMMGLEVERTPPKEASATAAGGPTTGKKSQ